MKIVTTKNIVIGGIGIVVLGAAYGIYWYLNKSSDKLIGKKVNYGNEGYVNVRSSPKIDKNLIKKATSNPVGKINKVVQGEDGYAWYEIKISGTGQTGYVREDAVTIK